MCLQVYPDGYGLGEGRYLSAFACMMIGEMDNALKWPFTGEVRFSLLNQVWDSNHSQHTVNCAQGSGQDNYIVSGHPSQKEIWESRVHLSGSVSFHQRSYPCSHLSSTYKMTVFTSKLKHYASHE